jgi:hypothetical protein
MIPMQAAIHAFRRTGMLSAGLLCALLVAACGEGCSGSSAEGEIPCNQDSDCPVDQICEFGTCAVGERDGNPTSDAGPAPADAGPPVADSGPPPPDSGPPPVDAGPPPPPDAGPLLDAAISDGGQEDADASVEDSGPADAGPPDAGPLDAGPPDAGITLDTGPGCIDNDSDGRGVGCPAGPDCLDNDPSVWEEMDLYIDADGDDYNFSNAAAPVCTNGNVPNGYNDAPSAFLDCNDGNDTIWEQISVYVDSDGDGYTVGGIVGMCTNGTPPAGYATSKSSFDDCLDSDNQVWENLTLYVDGDGDSYTVGASSVVCTDGSPPMGYADAQSSFDDCDDVDPSVWEELTGFLDADQDGSTVGTVQTFCTDGALPLDHTANGSILDDCNDALEEASSLLSTAEEICDGLDNDCDGNVDNGAGANQCPCVQATHAGHVYLACADEVDFTDAAWACWQLGYALTTVDDATEKAFLENLAVTNNPGTSSWIGLNDLTTENTYLLMDDAPAAYLPWAGSQPDNNEPADDFLGLGEDCGTIFHNGNGLNDFYCDEADPFLCEADPQRTSYDVLSLPSPLFSADFNTADGNLDLTRWYITRTDTGPTATISSQSALFDLPGAGANHELQLIATGMPSVDYSEVTFSFQFSGNDNARILRINLKASGGWEADGNNATNCYQLEIGPNDNVELVNSIDTNTNALDVANLDVGNELHYVRFQVDAAGVRARIWSEADGGVEPSTWLVSSTNTALTAPGKLYIVSYNSNAESHTVTLDDIVVTQLP